MKIAFFIARVMVVSLFLMSAYGKITEFDAQVALTASKGVPLANIAIILAIIFEIVGGILLLIGKKGAGFGALLLLTFTLIVTPIFFNIFQDTSTQNMNNFVKNISLSGGLLFIMLYYKSDFEWIGKWLKKGK